MRRARLALSLFVLATQVGCSGLADIASTASAVASGAATGNPAVAIGVGGVVNGAISASSKAYARINARSFHAAVVAKAAPLEVGQSDVFREEHQFTHDVTGRVEVTRLIHSPLATCKEIAFTIDDDGAPSPPYYGAICVTGNLWRWALAEPSTERWSILR